MSNDQRNGYDIWKELNAQDPKKAEEFLDRNFERPTEDDPADVVEAPPSQEEVAEMAAECERLRVEREGPDVDQKAQDFEDRMIQQREREANAPRAVPGSYGSPFKCEDDLPAPVFATVQTALAGRSTLTSLEQIAFIRALETHGLTLTVLDYPHPTKPFFLLQLVSTHLRPASGWYVY